MLSSIPFFSAETKRSAAGSPGGGAPDIPLHADVQAAAACGLKVIFQIQLSQHIFCLAEILQASGLHGAVHRLAEGHPHRGAGDHTPLRQVRRAFQECLKGFQSDDEVGEGLARTVLLRDVGQSAQISSIPRFLPLFTSVPLPFC